jgi:hypothetical protein
MAMGLCDVLVADDRPAAGNLTGMGKFMKSPMVTIVRRQASSLKKAVSRWTGIPRAILAKLNKAVVLTIFVFIGIGVFLRGELLRE